MVPAKTIRVCFSQLQKGLDEREALDCFILDYVDYCTVMGWFEAKADCKYGDQFDDGKEKQWQKPSLCMSTLYYEHLCPQR